VKRLVAIFFLLWLGVARAEEPTPAPTPTATPAVLSGRYSTNRFVIRYTPRAEGTARVLVASIEATRDDFASVLGRDWPGVTEVRVGVGRDELEAIALPGKDRKPPSWATALAYPDQGIILLEAFSLSEPDGASTFRHELSHVALGRIAAPGAWPRWFHEGLAMYLTGEQRYSVAHYTTLFRAVKQDRVFHFDDLTNEWPDQPTDVEIAYAQSVSFVSFLADRHGPASFAELLDHMAGGEPFETAFAKAFHASLFVDENAWRRELPARYSWWPIVTGGSTLWIFASAICVVAYVRRRRAVLAWRAAQEAEEAAHEAAMRILNAEAEKQAAGEPIELPDELGAIGDETASKAKPTLH
jgi:hypothetical protein